jgi:hypothetical protein
MANSPCKNVGNTVLLVEGVDDCHVVLALCAKFAVPETFGIHECGSDTKAIQRLNALVASPEPPRVIGLVIDADRPDQRGRWNQVRAKLAHYDYEFPEDPIPEGTVVEPVSEVPRLGFWLMPNNQDSGMLEDFCSAMIDNRAMAATRECIEFARSNGICTFKSVHYSKAVVHTFLALQDEPGRPLGQSITAQTLQADTPTTHAFVAWLIRLFGTS